MLLRLKDLVILAACLVHSVPAAANEAEEISEIRAAVLEIEEAFTNQDLAKIRSMFTADHLSITERYGGAINVEEQFETIGLLKRSTFDHTPFQVDIFGADSARVTYEQSYTGTYKDEPMPPRVFVTQIWLKRDGKWLQYLYQETPLALP